MLVENSQLLLLAAIFSLFYLVQKLVAFQDKIRAVKCAAALRILNSIGSSLTSPSYRARPRWHWDSNWPGFRTLISDRFIPFPFRLRGVSPGPQWTLYQKYEDYAKAGTDILAAVSSLPRHPFLPGDVTLPLPESPASHLL